MKLTYPATFYPWEAGEGFTVEVPDLPGCVSEGASFIEAQDMGIDAASGWILSELEDGKPIPKASNIKDVRPDEGGFVSMLVLDIDAYTEKYGKKTVRKNLTIPAWLNTFAEEHHINFSKVLRESLFGLYRKNKA
jgi:predicted RNase H-like HicB family nuclease